MPNGNLYKKHRVTDFVKNLGFSLCAVLSVCCRVTTSEGRMEFKRVSSDKKCVAIKHQSLVFNDIQLLD